MDKTTTFMVNLIEFNTKFLFFDYKNNLNTVKQ